MLYEIMFFYLKELTKEDTNKYFVYVSTTVRRFFYRIYKEVRY